MIYSARFDSGRPGMEVSLGTHQLGAESYVSLDANGGDGHTIADAITLIPR